jgi:phage terminase small subunit
MRELDGSKKRPRHQPQPQYPPLAVEAPQNMSPAELAHWNYYAPLLTASRVLTAADRDALRRNVLALAMVDEIVAEKAPGWRTELRHWLTIARLCAADLGLTPASRGRVATAPTDPGTDASPLAKLLARAELRRVK